MSRRLARVPGPVALGLMGIVVATACAAPGSEPDDGLGDGEALVERFAEAGVELKPRDGQDGPEWRGEYLGGSVGAHGDPVDRVLVLLPMPEIADVSESGRFPGSAYVDAIGMAGLVPWVAEQLRTQPESEQWSATEQFGRWTATAEFHPASGGVVERGTLSVSVARDGA